MSERIIIVEDDQGVRFFLEEALKMENYKVSAFESYEDAYRSIGNNTDLVIMDINLPGLDGLSAISEIKAKYAVPILIITAYGTKKNALEAIKRGATDFFVKPILLDELKVILRRVLGTRALKKEVEEMREKELEKHTFHGVVGRSAQMKDIFKEVEKIAGKGLNVLITGETGVGKEEIAKLIHILSRRKGQLVIVNCASIPDNLLESELFGYEKGAFTGAVQQKAGKFEVAHQGSIVLDEIGEMSPYLQAKLLRVVEKQEIEHLGGTKTRQVDVHVISTTNRVLENEIKDGKFREDLFFRLSQIHITVPPLRDRRDDVEALVNLVLRNIENDTGRVMTVSDDATTILMAYPWPGNARELIGAIKRAAVMSDSDIIGIDDLPLHLRAEHPLTGKVNSEKLLDDAISALEKTMIVDALKQCNGSQARAAKLLGISERSMWYRVKKYEIET
ncbi:MAG: sigma-54-dependent transcriptional regulator [Syntrophorhabdaceae bacterium]